MRVGGYYGNWQPSSRGLQGDFESRTRVTVRGARKLLNSAAHDSGCHGWPRQGPVGFGTFYVRNLSVVIKRACLRRTVDGRVAGEIA
jgi:hypothetical protein